MFVKEKVVFVRGKIMCVCFLFKDHLSCSGVKPVKV